MSNRKKSANAGGDAVWVARPASGDWNTAANWSANSVPTGTATFSATQNAAITFAPGSNATVQEIAFDDQAPAYTFTFADADPTSPALTIAGTGCSNAGTTTQQFKVASASQNYKQAQLKFINSASAGGPNVLFVSGPAGSTAIGGGVIGFYDTATAGSAVFTVRTGSGQPPKNSTVGGEVSFSNTSNAGTAAFTIYGSAGTANQGDTFGNVVFHDSSSAANATFTNAGATVAPGDGGNTQFYDSSTAASALFYNYGATVSQGNGGDVAFDGRSNAGSATLHNYPSTAAGGYGGVVSFNNNWPPVAVNQGASAAKATIYNLGAKAAGQFGGHTSFSAIYGSPSGDQATIFNYGSAVASNSASAAGHTTFSVTTPQTGAAFTPSAGNANIWNGGGLVSGAPGGLTAFTNYGANNSEPVGPNGPSAGSAIIVNIGAGTAGAKGGATVFSYWANAANATLVAMGGFNGGYGGSISFSGNASGGSASVWIQGNGVLDISYLNAPTLTIKNLVTLGGTIVTSVGSSVVSLTLSNQLKIEGGILNFSFDAKGVTAGQAYTILTAPNMSAFLASQFSGNAVNGQSPQFSISGNNLQVTFGSGGGGAKTAPKRKAKTASIPRAKPASRAKAKTRRTAGKRPTRR